MRGRSTTLWTTGFARALLRQRAAGPTELTYYTKPGCSLCVTGFAIAARVARACGATLTVLDIESDPELLARWGARVPVVAAGEAVLAEGRFDRRDLRRALAAYRRPEESR